MTANILAYVPQGEPNSELYLLLSSGSYRATVDNSETATWVRDAVNAYTGTEPSVNGWSEVDCYDSGFGALVSGGCLLTDGSDGRVWVPSSDPQLLAAINAYTG